MYKFEVIGKGVESIHFQAFAGCEKLENVYCFAETIPNCNVIQGRPSPFIGSNISNATLVVPASLLSQYKTADEWKNFGTIKAWEENLILSDETTTEFENLVTLTYDKIDYTRNFTNTKWQSLYVPFTMRYEDWKDDYDVSFINSVRQYDNNNDGTIDETIMDVLQITGGELYPNMPYLIKAKTTGEKTISLQNATLYPTEENSIECSTMLSTFTFTGTYSTIPAATLEENGYYAMGGGGLIMTNGTSNLKPFRWYMGITSRSPMYNTSTDNPSRISVHVIGEEDDMETSLYGVAREEELDDQIFNFNGQMMDASEPLVPGFYIKNGKKVIIR